MNSPQTNRRMCQGLLLAACLLHGGAAVGQDNAAPLAPGADSPFARELVEFTPYAGNPVFTATGADTWDRAIRERGYILREANAYYLFYTGYTGERDAAKHLGLATSPDGIHWTRDPANPVHTEGWVEDVCVIRHEANYILFAEGRDDIAHQLISTDLHTWREEGDLVIRHASGQPLSAGPYGTPSVWFEDGVWNLFFERRDAGVWLARSTDRRIWTLVQEDPVLCPGPDRYDRAAIALNQIVKHAGRYYAYYHGTAEEPWKDWCTNVAMSNDLIHWRKYPRNPLVTGNRSSGMVIPDGTRFRLYTMHPDVRLYWGYQADSPGEAGGSR